MTALLLRERSDADQPANRLLHCGPAALTTDELLSLLIVGGGADGLAVAGDIMRKCDGSLRRLASHPDSMLSGITGLGQAGRIKVQVALELGRRMAVEDKPLQPRIRAGEDIVALFGVRLKNLPVEEFHMVALDAQARALKTVLVSRGLLNSSLVHPREVFRTAIAEGAAGVVLVHNHPSGDPTPSPEDQAVTRQLVAAGKLLDLPVFDHVIIAGDRFTSFAAAGLL